jgi:hypothetical protein
MIPYHECVTLSVRPMAVCELPLSRAPLKDSLVGRITHGLLIEAVLGALCFSAVCPSCRDGYLALALLAAGMTATIMGLLFP